MDMAIPEASHRLGTKVSKKARSLRYPINSGGVSLPKCRPWRLTAVMELPKDAMPSSSLVADESLQLPWYGPGATGWEEVSPAFQVSDYMAFHEGSLEGSPFAGAPALPAQGSGDPIMVGQTSNVMKCEVGGKMVATEPEGRVAFRTKSTVDILDDGYKWKKYGKKSIKSSPNPRNYYRCSADGCSVKKRVERDPEDPSFVVTTYDGVHSHLPHGVVYYPVSRDHAAADWGSSCSWMEGTMVATQPSVKASQTSVTTQVAHPSS